ncbi:hypothetical protein [Pseudomonas gessardii]|uniref:Uncharacterized protein n=1 Tax=Pseudomonas gessardii TaxID=78544 RepID=A0A7Y1QM64_9PSED|nr:hypothetical protein [Pseudomonas gessardii]MBH3421897.1 hypothetical protein [Pseudomonas gessardii]NNA65977.1 hypothetical protein [Pseudomonas gessardii]NNA89206.1 hypothetical protein [Pseudomonas gessardii]NNA95478.1 hypothetical protein [Pseudomonas gessardii]
MHIQITDCQGNAPTSKKALTAQAGSTKKANTARHTEKLKLIPATLVQPGLTVLVQGRQAVQEITGLSAREYWTTHFRE